MLTHGHLSAVEDMDVDSLGEVLLEFLFSGPDEHVMHKERVIGAGAESPDLEPVVGIPADIPVDHVAPPLVVDVVDCELFDQSERFLTDRDILRTLPLHSFFRLGVLHDALLQLVAGLVQPRISTKGAVVRDLGVFCVDIRWLLKQEGDLVHLRHCGVVEDVLVLDAHEPDVLRVLARE